MTWPVVYAPGEALGCALDDLIVLVALPADDPRFLGVVRAVDAGGATLESVVDILISAGLTAVQTFGVAERSEAGTRVLVRGACRAEAPGLLAQAREQGLWEEALWPVDGEGVRLVVEPIDTSLPLGSGVVRCAWLGWSGHAGDPVPSGDPALSGDASIASVETAPPPPVSPVSSASPCSPASPPSHQGVGGDDAGRMERQEEAEGGAAATVASPLTVPPPRDVFIATVPWSLDDPEAGVDQAPRSEQAEESVPPAEPPRGSGPRVQAVHCPEGHPNPIHATLCRQCGATVPAQQPVEVPRPSLGVLQLENGDVVALERGAILGRNPQMPEGWSGERPHLVRVEDPSCEVSGQHLEVRLDAWHVLVCDCGSTNGTEVILPGSEPVLLRPHEQMSIEVGTRILLAGVFALTYEAGA